MTQPANAAPLPQHVGVVNVGLPLFADAVASQGAPVISVDWRVPAGGQPALVAALGHGPATPFLSLRDYRALSAALPEPVRTGVQAAWGAPEDDPSVVDGQFVLRWLRSGNAIMAVQPDRGRALDRLDPARHVQPGAAGPTGPAAKWTYSSESNQSNVRVTARFQYL